jgi:protein-L-isoaspartate(D-aspartate) O-methyltransferase
MYYGSRASWNLRDRHMFDTLKTFYGYTARTPRLSFGRTIFTSAMPQRARCFLGGEYNVGHLCRKQFGNLAYAIGFGTHRGTVAAAANWDGPMEVKTVLPAIPESYSTSP